MHLKFVEPSRQFADLIVPHGGENPQVVNLITSTISDYLEKIESETT